MEIYCFELEPLLLGQTRRPSGDPELHDGALALKKWAAGLHALHLGGGREHRSRDGSSAGEGEML
jgi:hypothetical protein